MAAALPSAMQQFYSGKTLLLTGATGFVGKVLLEKVLFALPDIARIYIVVRDKRGLTAQQRLEQLADAPVFTAAHRVPSSVIYEKVTPLCGDVSLQQLGLSDDDWQRLVSEVNIIIHCAASVRFDDPIAKALATNCVSTMACLELCRQAQKIKAFVHVSTCFSNFQLNEIDERVYPCLTTAEHLLELVASGMPSSELDTMCKEQFYDGRPNSYMFSKALAEQYLEQNSNGLPVAIARLATVTAARREPHFGFIDVLQAATAIGYAQALGVMRTIDYDPTAIPDIVPVDTAVNAILAIAARTASGKLIVYNITYPCVRSYQQLGATLSQELLRMPTLAAVRTPVDLSVRRSRFGYHYTRWVSEWLFTLVVHVLLRICGFNYNLMSKLKFMDKTRETMEAVGRKRLQFVRGNFLQLSRCLNGADSALFPVETSDMPAEEYEHYVRQNFLCVRKYILHEGLEMADMARARVKWLMLGELFVYAIICALLYAAYMCVVQIVVSVL